MEVSFDPATRATTLAERELDFADAATVFDSRAKTAVDDRLNYGEVRHITYGWIGDVAVAVVWTGRDEGRRVISMRRMHQWKIKYVGLD